MKEPDFGAFVTFMPGKDRLVQVSIKNERVENVRDILEEGQEVKVLEVDPRGKIHLSMRVVDADVALADALPSE